MHSSEEGHHIFYLLDYKTQSCCKYIQFMKRISVYPTCKVVKMAVSQSNLS